MRTGEIRKLINDVTTDSPVQIICKARREFAQGERVMKLWSEMDTNTIRETLKKTNVVILPIGSTEQHGPHLPTGTDYYIGEEIARRVAHKLDALLLPTIPFGFSLWRITQKT